MRLRLDLINQEPAEHALLSTLVAVMTDPALSGARTRLLNGELAMVIEGEDVSWINPCELVEAPTRDEREEVVE